MDLKIFIVLLCIELSLAYYKHRHVPYHYDPYSYEDYSDHKHGHVPYHYDPHSSEDYTEEITPKALPKTTTTQKNVVKTNPQYEVTENIIDIPDDATVNRRIDTNFTFNKTLNQVPDLKTINVTDNKRNKPDKNELMKNLEDEYKSIVSILAGNKQTHENIVDIADLLSKINNMWGKFRRTIEIISEGVNCINKTRSLVQQF